MTEFFDPFKNRTARDIRNSLTTAFVSEITGKHPGAVGETVQFWLSRTLNPVYLDYIKEMQARYTQTLEAIRSTGCEDTRYQSVLLWNSGLFFEMHELLETIFIKTRGRERLALKGLIQAAGVYVHTHRGNQKAALGLAVRARKNLSAVMEQLWFIENPNELVENLKDPNKPPIKLDMRSG